MPNYIRAFVPGGTFFFTVALLERKRSLLTEHVDDLRLVFSAARRRRPFVIDAIVILPDHLHCIWTLPPGDSDFSTRWHDIKSRFAAKVSHGERRSIRRQNKGERGIWQRRFWEHMIRDGQDLSRHIDYIHYNLVKHGHVDRVTEWPYSSFHRYVRLGVLPQNWAAVEEVRQMDVE